LTTFNNCTWQNATATTGWRTNFNDCEVWSQNLIILGATNEATAAGITRVRRSRFGYHGGVTNIFSDAGWTGTRNIGGIVFEDCIFNESFTSTASTDAAIYTSYWAAWGYNIFFRNCYFGNYQLVNIKQAGWYTGGSEYYFEHINHIEDKNVYINLDPTTYAYIPFATQDLYGWRMDPNNYKILPAMKQELATTGQGTPEKHTKKFYFPNEAGETYRVGVWMKISASMGRYWLPTFGVRYFTGTPPNLEWNEDESETYDFPNRWFWYEHIITPSVAGNIEVRFIFYGRPSGFSPAVVWLDELGVEKIS
jgi:hypothetical protein